MTTKRVIKEGQEWVYEIRGRDGKPVVRVSHGRFHAEEPLPDSADIRGVEAKAEARVAAKMKWREDMKAAGYVFEEQPHRCAAAAAAAAAAVARINEQERRDLEEFDRQTRYDTPGYYALFGAVLFVSVLLPCVSYLYFYG